MQNQSGISQNLIDLRGGEVIMRPYTIDKYQIIFAQVLIVPVMVIAVKF